MYSNIKSDNCVQLCSLVKLCVFIVECVCFTCTLHQSYVYMILPDCIITQLDRRAVLGVFAGRIRLSSFGYGFYAIKITLPLKKLIICQNIKCMTREIRWSMLFKLQDIVHDFAAKYKTAVRFCEAMLCSQRNI